MGINKKNFLVEPELTKHLLQERKPPSHDVRQKPHKTVQLTHRDRTFPLSKSRRVIESYSFEKGFKLSERKKDIQDEFE